VARRAAFDVLQAVRTGTPFAAALDRAAAGLSERDRRLAYELSAGVLRSRGALDRELEVERADPRLRDILRLGVYQLRRLARVPAHAAVSTSVELAREAAGQKAARYVNQALRRIAHRARDGTASREREGDRSHPAWLVTRWRRHFGDEGATGLVAWNDSRPALTLQPGRWEPATLVSRLTAAGIAVAEAPFGAGLRIASTRVASLPGYDAGAFLVQDPAQALAVHFAAIPAGAGVYDACAAPGGKAVRLAQHGAAVVAGEARRERLERLRDTLRRLGVAVPVVAADLLAAPFRPDSWDAVLVDAPCTATGTMARHPDARWRLTPEAITRLARRQATLLDAASRLVHPGGLLVYTTCSLEPEENEAQVDAFLHRHPEFDRRPVTGLVPPILYTGGGDFQSLPHRDGIDGAYAARLERSA
jgi:16S rRNA (cytosine967-C5)-methyltransferase